MLRRTTIIMLAALLVGAVLLTARVTRAEFGTNWTAQYYNNTNLSGDPAATQTGLPGVNFSYGSGSPVSGVNTDNFSARFTSTQTFAAGTYDFVVTADDGVRVLIDGAVVLDRFVARPQTTDTFTQTMTAGSHSLIVEYFEAGDQATIQFQWFLTSAANPGTVITPGVVSTQAFFGTPGPTLVPTAIPPTSLPPIPEGALTAIVIEARVLNVRNAPFPGADRVGQIRRGETYAVIGRNANARWFLLQLGGYQAWAWGYYLFINGNEFNAPVVSSYVTLGNPAAQSGVVGQSHQGLKLRAAPTTESEQIGRIGWGDLMPITGISADGRWYEVIYKNTPGWVTVDYMRIVEGDVALLPVR